MKRYFLFGSLVFLAACADRPLADINEVTTGQGVPDAPVPDAPWPDAAPPDAPPPPDAAPPDAAACSDGSSGCVCMEVCTPGVWRWCDGPVYCLWAKQTCLEDGTWGQCIEAMSEPPGCNTQSYDQACCYASGDCCQQIDPDTHNSIGNCPGVSIQCHLK